MLQKSGFNVTRGAQQVRFMIDLFWHSNLGPNVDVNFFVLVFVLVLALMPKTHLRAGEKDPSPDPGSPRRKNQTNKNARIKGVSVLDSVHTMHAQN